MTPIYKKTYLVNYAYGIVGTSENQIEIETTTSLSEDFIRERIYEKYPSHKGQIMAIFEAQLIKEEQIGGFEEDLRKTMDGTDIPIFNWDE